MPSCGFIGFPQAPITEDGLLREFLLLPIAVEPGLQEQEGMSSMLLFPPSADSSGDGGIRLGSRAGAFALALEKTLIMLFHKFKNKKEA